MATLNAPEYGIRVVRRDVPEGIRYVWSAWARGRTRKSGDYLDPLEARLAAESWLNYQMRPMMTAEELASSDRWWENTA